MCQCLVKMPEHCESLQSECQCERSIVIMAVIFEQAHRHESGGWISAPYCALSPIVLSPKFSDGG